MIHIFRTLFLAFCLFSCCFCTPQEEIQKKSVSTIESIESETEDENDDNNNEEDEDEIEVIIIDEDEKDSTNGTLNSNVAPSENFNLSNWKISLPIDNGEGFATEIDVSKMILGYQHSTYFYTGEDGAMVFKNYIDGFKTSANTTYTRSELREMLRGTDTSIKTTGLTKNNWVFGTAPQSDINLTGGYDGKLTATLAVNHVTTTGSSSQVGRVIIGQIHANSDEPIRLYYRKLPNNELGSVYYAHEPNDGYGDEQWIDVIGSKSSSADNPSDGIALNEKFTYVIDVIGDVLKVTIQRADKEDVISITDMKNSGFNIGGQYMYFKAGVYTQNKTGLTTDYDQASFYKLEASHSGS